MLGIHLVPSSNFTFFLFSQFFCLVLSLSLYSLIYLTYFNQILSFYTFRHVLSDNGLSINYSIVYIECQYFFVTIFIASSISRSPIFVLYFIKYRPNDSLFHVPIFWKHYFSNFLFRWLVFMLVWSAHRELHFQCNYWIYHWNRKDIIRQTTV